jgi:NAD(P)-dependent dehydrogenase (short-subunit alcohol dehydrogenase family)
MEERMTETRAETRFDFSGCLVLVTGGTSGIGADIAGAVLFLSSAAGSWMTGQTIVVDGGYSVVG